MKDQRLITVGKLIRHNEVTLFRQVLDTIPKTPLAREMGMKPERMNRILDEMDLFTMREIFDLAELFEVKPSALITLVLNQFDADNKMKRKK
jgi:hypothetical protein